MNDDPKGRQLGGLITGLLAAPLIIFVLGPIIVRWLNAMGVILSLG